MPKVINNIYKLEINIVGSTEWCISYKSKYYMHHEISKNILEAAYKMLCWLAESKELKILNIE